MAYKNLLYSKEDGIGIVTINRPEVLNALNTEVLVELYEAFNEIEKDPEVRVAILTGAGGKAFAAGADIADMQPKNSVEIIKFQTPVRRAGDFIYNLSKPVIAAINGYCFGGGCELAMCCDLRIASDKSKFGQPEINLGLIPGAGGTQRLTRLVGMTKTKELVFLGDSIDASTALSIGLINKVVPSESVMEEAKAMARKLLSKSSIALFYAKKSINGGADSGLPTALDLEDRCFASCFATQDQKEGMKAFLEKRKPVFKNK